MRRELKPGPDPAVNIETRVAPGENPLGPFRDQELLADQASKNLPAEEFSQPGVVDPADLVEDAGLVHPALGDQEMKVRVEINPVAERLNSRDDSGHKVAPG